MCSDETNELCLSKDTTQAEKTIRAIIINDPEQILKRNERFQRIILNT